MWTEVLNFNVYKPRGIGGFSFNTLNMSLHLLLVYMVSEEKFSVILIFVPGVFNSQAQPHGAFSKSSFEA